MCTQAGTLGKCAHKQARLYKIFNEYPWNSSHVSITNDKTHLYIDRRHCSDYDAHREWLISARVHKIAQWPNMCKCRNPETNIKVQCSAQKHDPLFAIVIFGASTTNSQTKNALNTIVWGCGLCLVVPGNEVMIRVKYCVSWALVGLLPKHKYSLFHFFVSASAQKNHNICETE